jgi:hypothetical protein
MSNEPIYYQFHKTHSYPVIIRLDSSVAEGRLQKVISDLGFFELSEAEKKTLPLNKASTKILSLKKAPPRIIQQVKTPDTLDSYGLESLQTNNNFQIYTYRNLGMMIFSYSSSYWELGLCSDLNNTEELTHLRIMLTRFVSWALGPLGIIGYWGVTTQDGMVVMKQAHSFGESVFLDLDNKRILSGQTEKKFGGDFTIFRAEKTVPQNKTLSKEELISFLSTASNYFSYGGLPTPMKRNIFLLGSMTRGEYSPLALPETKTLSSSI